MTTEGGIPAPQSEDGEQNKRGRRAVAWWWWAAGGGALIVVILAVVMLAGDDADDAGDPNPRVQALTAETTASTGGSSSGGGTTATGTPISEGERPDIEGIWEFVVNVTAASGVCEGEEDEAPGTGNVTIRRLDDGSYEVSGLGSTPGSAWNGWWEDDDFVFQGERDEDGGVTAAKFRMHFEDGVFAGEEDWSWSDPNGDCPNGKSEVDAYFYGPLS